MTNTENSTGRKLLKMFLRDLSTPVEPERKSPGITPSALHSLANELGIGRNIITEVPSQLNGESPEKHTITNWLSNALDEKPNSHDELGLDTSKTTAQRLIDLLNEVSDPDDPTPKKTNNLKKQAKKIGSSAWKTTKKLGGAAIGLINPAASKIWSTLQKERNSSKSNFQEQSQPTPKTVRIQPPPLLPDPDIVDVDFRDLED